MPKISPTPTQTARGYRPAEPISVPPIFVLPLQLPACVRWFWQHLVFPYGVFYLGLAALTWVFLLPDLAQMATVQPGWVAMIWLRNAVLLGVIAGGLQSSFFDLRKRSP